MESTPQHPAPASAYGILPEQISVGERADDKRPGALCDRPQCVARMVARIAAGKPGTLRVTSAGNLAVKHNRGGSKDRRARALALYRKQQACTWCAAPLALAEVEQDRIIGACEYSARNLVVACKACNNLRNRAATGDNAESFARNDAPDAAHALVVRAGIFATHPEFHA